MPEKRCLLTDGDVDHDLAKVRQLLEILVRADELPKGCTLPAIQLPIAADYESTNKLFLRIVG